MSLQLPLNFKEFANGKNLTSPQNIIGLNCSPFTIPQKLLSLIRLFSHSRLGINTILCFTFLLVFSCSNATAQQSWTLEKCISHALENNISVRQAGLQKDISKKQLTQSYLSTFLPTVDASATYNVSFGNSVNQFDYTLIAGSLQTVTGNMSGSLPLFTGLQQLHNIQKTKKDFQAAYFDAEEAKNNISLSITSAFLNVILAKEILKVAEHQLTLTNEQLSITEKRVKSGSLPEASLLEFQAQQARNQVDIINAKNQIDLAVLNMRNLLQIPVESGFELATPEINANTLSLNTLTSPVEVYKFALNNQPSIKSAEARLGSALSSLRISRGAFSPTLSVFGQVGTNYSDQSRRPTAYDTLQIPGLPPQYFGKDYQLTPFADQLKQSLRSVVGISLNIPIISKGQRFTNEQISKIQLQLRELDLQNRRNQLQQQITEAYANARAASESFIANQKSLDAAQQSFDAIKKRFEIGLVTQFDFERSRINVISAESQMLQAKYTFVFRQKVLDFYQGKPITLQ